MTLIEQHRKAMYTLFILQAQNKNSDISDATFYIFFKNDYSLVSSICKATTQPDTTQYLHRIIRYSCILQHDKMSDLFSSTSFTSHTPTFTLCRLQHIKVVWCNGFGPLHLMSSLQAHKSYLNNNVTFHVALQQLTLALFSPERNPDCPSA